MTRFQFTRDFPWWGPNPKCKLCALALWMFTRANEPVDIPDDAADAAELAGAGQRVEYTGMAQ